MARGDVKYCLFLMALAIFGCTKSQEYKWAFAQNMDNTFLANEYCRESLDQSLYADVNQSKIVREANSHAHIFNGATERYRVYGFKEQSECEVALTNMKLRSGN